MARAFCIIKERADDLKQAFREGKITVSDLYSASSEKRLSVFSEFADTDLSHYLNSQFEKALVSKNVTKSLKAFFGKNIDPKLPQAKSLFDKIDDLEKTGFMDANGNYLDDLVDAKLGVRLTEGQMKFVSETGDKLEALYQKKHPNLSFLPDVEYWTEVNKFEKYLKGLNPSDPLSIIMSTVARGNMLLSGGGPSTNIISNKINSALMAFERRVAERGLVGPNFKLAKEFFKYNMEVYIKSGKDLSRMPNFASAIETQMAEGLIHAEGPGVGRKIVRAVYEDGVFKYLYGFDDVVSATQAFIDKVDLVALRIAKDEGLTGKALKTRHAELVQQALSLDVEPGSLGEKIRNLGVRDATTTTYTNNPEYVDKMLKIRNILNEGSTARLRPGDIIMPFVKTVANIVNLGLDIAGKGILEGAIKFKGALREYKAGNTRPMSEVIGLWARSGVGMVVGYALAVATKPDDYMPDYMMASTKDKARAKVGNIPYNSVRIDDVWYSLDLLGPIATPFVGFMNGFKGTDPLDATVRYLTGEALQLSKLPGIPNISEAYRGAVDTITKISQGKGALPIAESAATAVESRGVPTGLGHIAQATDIPRDTSGDFGQIIAQFPWLRQLLPPKIDQMTGEVEQSSPAWMTLIFGSRIRASKDDPVVNEVNRLAVAGYMPTTDDIATSFDEVKSMKAQLSQSNFTKALEIYGTAYHTTMSNKMASLIWKTFTDQQKKEAFDNARKASLSNMKTYAISVGWDRNKK